jgi:hypothetical protein
MCLEEEVMRTTVPNDTFTTKRTWKIVQSLSANYCLQLKEDGKIIVEKPPRT